MKISTHNITRKLLAAAALAVGVGALAPQQAEACGGAWYPEVQIDYRIQGIAAAEKQLEQGQHANAAASVIRMIPHIRNYKAKSGDPIINRAMRVLAVATVRSGGELAIGKQIPYELRGQWLAQNDGDKTANLDWAVVAMRSVNTWKSDDPAVQTELGEALAKVDANKGEARDLLGDLADKDLLGSAEGYAALAELRAANGDEDGRIAALKRCEAMAKTPGLCQAPVFGQS